MIEENEKFLAEIKRHEGFRNAVYRCPTGHKSIGYGHNLEAAPIKGIGDKTVISTEEGERILRDDVKRFGAQLDERIPWWRDLDEARQAVLLNMAYNMGVSTLCKFTATLGYARAGRYDFAAASMQNSLWAKQVGGRAKELIERMETGEWKN